MTGDSTTAEEYLLVATAWSSSAVLGAPGAVLAFVLGAFVLLWPRRGRLDGLPGSAAVYAAVVAGIGIALTSDLVRIPEISPAGLLIWLGPVLWVVAIGLVRATGPRTLGGVAAVVAVVGVATSAVGVMAEHAGTNVGVDVYLAHVAAAHALGDGENPYSDAVRYPNGSPFAPEGAVIEGYGYPPVVLWSYGAATWSTGDPRWLNIAAWIGVIAVVLWRVHRIRPRLLVPAAVVLGMAPAWRLIVFTGWTEPLTVALLVGAALAWRKTPIASGVLLGLALASKQYMILLVPLLLLHRDVGQWRRLTTAGVTAGITLVPYALLDLDLYVDRLITRPLSFGFRPDTQSLPGLLDRLGIGPEIPLVIALVAVVWVSWIVTRRSAGADTFLIGTSIVLAVFFVLSLAFANYWFLVSSLLVAGASFGPLGGETPDLQPGPQDVSSRGTDDR